MWCRAWAATVDYIFSILSAAGSVGDVIPLFFKWKMTILIPGFRCCARVLTFGMAGFYRPVFRL
jgi:hypothetical protein